MIQPITPDDGFVDQYRQDLELYNKLINKDRCARIMVLSSMNDDLLAKYHNYSDTKELWDQLKFSFGGTSTTRLRSLVLKFKVYRKDPKHLMTEHLRVMSSIIQDLNVVGNAITDEQQVQAVIRSLPKSWIIMNQILTHNENAKKYYDISRHV